MAKLISLQAQCAKIAAEVRIYVQYVEGSQSIWDGECKSIADKIQQVDAFLVAQDCTGVVLNKEFMDACYKHKSIVGHTSAELKKTVSSLSALEKKDVSFTKMLDKLEEKINTFMLDSKNDEHKPACSKLLEQIVQIKQELVGLQTIKIAISNKIKDLNVASNANKQRLHKILTRVSVSQALQCCTRLEDKVQQCEEAIPSPRSISVMLERVNGIEQRLTALRSLRAGEVVGVASSVSTEVSIASGASIVGEVISTVGAPIVSASRNMGDGVKLEEKATILAGSASCVRDGDGAGEDVGKESGEESGEDAEKGSDEETKSTRGGSPRASL